MEYKVCTHLTDDQVVDDHADSTKIAEAFLNKGLKHKKKKLFKIAFLSKVETKNIYSSLLDDTGGDDGTFFLLKKYIYFISYVACSITLATICTPVFYYNNNIIIMKEHRNKTTSHHITHSHYYLLYNYVPTTKTWMQTQWKYKLPGSMNADTATIIFFTITTTMKE